MYTTSYTKLLAILPIGTHSTPYIGVHADLIKNNIAKVQKQLIQEDTVSSAIRSLLADDITYVGVNHLQNDTYVPVVLIIIIHSSYLAEDFKFSMKQKLCKSETHNGHQVILSFLVYNIGMKAVIGDLMVNSEVAANNIHPVL